MVPSFKYKIQAKVSHLIKITNKLINRITKLINYFENDANTHKNVRYDKHKKFETNSNKT